MPLRERKKIETSSLSPRMPTTTPRKSFRADGQSEPKRDAVNDCPVVRLKHQERGARDRGAYNYMASGLALSGKTTDFDALQVDDADWRTVVSQLMQRASMIFVELIHLSPGLREELDLLVSAGVQSRTVLMVDCAGSDEAAQQRLQQQLFGRPSGAATIDPNDPSLRVFRRVLSVAGVEADGSGQPV